MACVWTPCCQLASASLPVPFHFSVFFFAEPSQICRLPATEIPRARLSRKGCIKGCQVVLGISGKDQGLGWCLVEPEKKPNHAMLAGKACLCTGLCPQDFMERRPEQCCYLHLLQKSWVTVGRHHLCSLLLHSCHIRMHLIGKKELLCLCCDCKGVWEMWEFGTQWD